LRIFDLLKESWRGGRHREVAIISRILTRRPTMRKLLPMLAVTAVFSVLSLVVFAAEVKTIEGEGQCAKCALSETKSCQNAVKVEEGGKTVTYYLKHEGESKKFHSNLCKATKKVKATGDVQDEDGKKVMTVTKIELVD